MISKTTIDKIFETVKIEEVISDYIKLTRAGVNQKGLCPFHNEKTPSFTVSPAKNIYKCFGCGESGNSVNFIMNIEHLSYPEALKHLAKKYNIEVEEEAISEELKEKLKLADDLYVANQFAKDYFINQLKNTDYGKSVGLSYFRSRGYSDETIHKFGLGFAKGTQNDFFEYALKNGFSEEILENAGLIKNKRDFFKERVQFPIHNTSGKVIGFGGRILNNNKKAPKYLNTPESDIYNKRKTLYGLYFARNEMVRQDNCFMVEGYTDVISLHQSGIANVVASSGTSLTAEQVLLVKRFTPNLTILYDGDKAGVKAALRGLDIVIEQDMNVKIVLLPENEDPDSFVKKMGNEKFNDYIKKQAKDFILFKLELSQEEAQNDPVKKAALVSDIIKSISKIPDAIKRTFYVKQCADKLELTEQLLTNEINKLLIAAQKKSRTSQIVEDNQPVVTINTLAEEQPVQQNDANQEIDLARLIVNFGDRKIDDNFTVIEYILSDIIDLFDLEIMKEFDHELSRLIFEECFQSIRSNKNIEAHHFTHHSNPEISKFAADLLAEMSAYTYSDGWEKMNVFLNTKNLPDQNHAADTKSSILRFKLKKIERMILHNQEQLKSLQDKSDEKKLMLHLSVHQKLIDKRSEIALTLNTVVLK